MGRAVEHTTPTRKRARHVGALAVSGTLLLGAALVAAPGAASADPLPTTGSPLSSPLARLAASGEAAGTPEGAAAAGLPLDGPGSLAVDEAGRAVVELGFATFADQTAAVPAISALAEVRSVGVSAPTVTAYATVDLFDDIAALDGVTSVEPGLLSKHASTTAVGASLAPALGLSGTPDLSGTSCRSIPVNTAAALSVDAAQATYAVDGTGVTIGIISDSFDRAASSVATTAAQDVASGVLPGAGNPCGYETPVAPIHEDAPGVNQQTDEGRAMAQVVHGIAPGARLMFSTDGVTETELADSIQRLVDEGADVIVDDAVQFTEPWFQQGIVAQTIEKARDRGVLYVAAAQNEGSIGYLGGLHSTEIGSTGSWEAPAYRPTDCPANVQTLIDDAYQGQGVTADCNDFGRAGSPANSLEADFDIGSFDVLTQWVQSVGARSTLLVPFVLASDGSVLSGTQYNGTWDDVTPSSYAIVDAPGSTLSYEIVLARLSLGDTQTPRVKMIFGLDDGGVLSLPYASDEWPEGVVVGPTVFAHPADPAVLTSGAAESGRPGTMETYSGTGPATYYFGPVDVVTGTPAAPLPAPRVMAKPDLVGVDLVETSFFSADLVVDGHYYFAGTSAAAPTVAAVAALAMQYSPQSSAQQVREALLASAVPLPAQEWTYSVSDANVWGAGRVDALAALAALPPAPAPVPVVPAGGGSTRLADTGAAPDAAPVLALGAVMVGLVAAVLVRRRRRA